MPGDSSAIEYVQRSGSDFRYRLLDGDVDDGYEAAFAQLLPGEKLYRMMDGPHRVGGELFPILMDSEADFRQCVAKWGRFGFKLAAGIPSAKPGNFKELLDELRPKV